MRPPIVENMEHVRYYLPRHFTRFFEGLTTIPYEEILELTLHLATINEVHRRKRLSENTCYNAIENFTSLAYEYYLDRMTEDFETDDHNKYQTTEHGVLHDFNMVDSIQDKLRQYLFEDNDHFDDLLYCGFCVNYIDSKGYVYICFQDDVECMWDAYNS